MKCEKMRFMTRSGAKKFVKMQNRLNKLGLTSVYYCEACLGWHVTSNPKQSSRKKASKGFYKHIKQNTPPELLVLREQVKQANNLK